MSVSRRPSWVGLRYKELSQTFSLLPHMFPPRQAMVGKRGHPNVSAEMCLTGRVLCVLVFSFFPVYSVTVFSLSCCFLTTWSRTNQQINVQTRRTTPTRRKATLLSRCASLVGGVVEMQEMEPHTFSLCHFNMLDTDTGYASRKHDI